MIIQYHQRSRLAIKRHPLDKEASPSKAEPQSLSSVRDHFWAQTMLLPLPYTLHDGGLVGCGRFCLNENVSLCLCYPLRHLKQTAAGRAVACPTHPLT